MSTIFSGLVGGFVATIGMSIVMQAMGGGQSPTAHLLAKLRGGDPSAYQLPGMILHLLYGSIAGAVFVVVVDATALGITSPAEWVAAGVVYGVVLLVGGAMVWIQGIIGMDPDRELLIGFTVAHLVYGLILGIGLGYGVFA